MRVSSYSSSSTCCTLSMPTRPCRFSLTLTCSERERLTPAAGEDAHVLLPKC